MLNSAKNLDDTKIPALSSVSTPSGPPDCDIMNLRHPEEVIDKQVRVGIHCKKLSNLDIFAPLPVNMIELKVDQFPKSDKPFLFNPSSGSLVPVAQNLERIAEFARLKDAQVQLHFPAKFDLVDGTTTRLSVGCDNDHDILIRYFESLNDIWQKYGLADELIVTVHPPYEFLWYGIHDLLKQHGIQNVEHHSELSTAQRLQIEDTVLTSANRFLIRLGTEIEKHGWKIAVGVENQAYSAHDAWNVGYSIGHFELLMQNTPKPIQLTFDTGHSLLSRGDPDGITFRQFGEFARSHGKYLVNYHFHENQGWMIDPERHTYQADLHSIPTNERIPGFYRYHLRRCAIGKVPATLEIKATKIEPTELRTLLNSLWDKIGEHLAK